VAIYAKGGTAFSTEPEVFSVQVMELVPSRKIHPATTHGWRGTARLKTMTKWLTNANRQIAGWLRMGISPQRLALTLALGFAIGCLPVIGVPTALCAVVAIGFGLNVPVIQAANYAAMPVQIALILPLARLGGWMFQTGQRPGLTGTFGHGLSMQTLWASGNVAGHALAAWVVIAGPMVVLLTLALTPVLQRVPAFASEASE
jgi:uncharacterized protein (DUF2062 family)